MFPLKNHRLLLFILLCAVLNIKHILGVKSKTGGHKTGEYGVFYPSTPHDNGQGHKINRPHDGTGHDIQGRTIHQGDHPEHSYESPELYSSSYTEPDTSELLNEFYNVAIENPDMEVNTLLTGASFDSLLKGLEQASIELSHPLNTDLSSTFGHEYSANHRPQQEAGPSSEAQAERRTSNSVLMENLLLLSRTKLSRNILEQITSNYKFDRVKLVQKLLPEMIPHTALQSMLKRGGIWRNYPKIYSAIKDYVNSVVKDKMNKNIFSYAINSVLNKMRKTSQVRQEVSHTDPSRNSNDQHRAGPSSEALAEQSSSYPDFMEELQQVSLIPVSRNRLDEITLKYQSKRNELVRQLRNEMIPDTELRTVLTRGEFWKKYPEIYTAIKNYVNNVVEKPMNRYSFYYAINSLSKKVTQTSEVTLEFSHKDPSQNLNDQHIAGPSSEAALKESSSNSVFMDKLLSVSRKKLSRERLEEITRTYRNQRKRFIPKLLQEMIPKTELQTLKTQGGLVKNYPEIYSAIRYYVNDVVENPISLLYFRYAVRRFLLNVAKTGKVKSSPFFEPLAEQSLLNSKEELMRISRTDLTRNGLEEITSGYENNRAMLIRRLLTVTIPETELQTLQARGGILKNHPEIYSAIKDYVNHVAENKVTNQYAYSIINRFLKKVAKEDNDRQGLPKNV